MSRASTGNSKPTEHLQNNQLQAASHPAIGPQLINLCNVKPFTKQGCISLEQKEYMEGLGAMAGKETKISANIYNFTVETPHGANYKQVE